MSIRAFEIGTPALAARRPRTSRRLPYGSVMVLPPLLKRAVSLALLVGLSPLGVGWFAVKTRTVRDDVTLPAMSATTRRTSWAPSDRAAVLKEKDPLAASGQGTTALVNQAQDESAACAGL